MVLKQSFLRDGRCLDQALWSILEAEWRRAKAVWESDDAGRLST
jgi:hypothetical protein